MKKLLLFGQRLSGNLTGIAAFVLQVFRCGNFDKCRAQALDLLFHRWPDVKSLHDRAQPPRRGDGLEARRE